MSMPTAGRVVRFNRPSKFRNKKTILGGLVFDSKREAKRYGDLRLLESNGEVRNLRRQVKYDLTGIRIATYTADFVYELRSPRGVWAEVTEDVKGYPNDRFPMKKKLMLACHNIRLLVTK